MKKLADECHNLVCSCNLKLYKPLRISSPLFFSLDYDEDFEGSDAEKEDDYEDDFDDGDKDQSEHSARSPAQSSRRSRSRSPAHSDDEDKTAREVSDVHEFFICHHLLAIWLYCKIRSISVFSLSFCCIRVFACHTFIVPR